MNLSTQRDVISIIEARLEAMRNGSSSPSGQARLEGEIEMAIDLAHLTGAIDLPLRNHFIARRDRMIANDHQQWERQCRRLA
ncbi:hypothetical protein [Pseudomonas sp. CM27]|uniref:hypothetical protein n=1 Tax=Pseudomonas sp. CM27 TaxID=2738452 RepID=UPI0006DBCEC2|nr:hypothetical protein [Pseudomonas sp. CM27]KPM64149.1 hypothetical protein HB4184_11120 [Pseudomonas putida]NQD74582.1 hypothetical protein [Pseudomonas sp. CM27]